MTRSARFAADAVNRVIKAYDVRGLVGEEIDETFVAEVGAAFARLVAADSSQVVIGYDMRESSPGLAAGLRDRCHRPGPRRGADRVGLHRPVVFRVGISRLPGGDVHCQPQSGRLQRHQAVPRRCQARRSGDRAGHHPRCRSSPGCRPATAPAKGVITDRDVLTEYGTFLRSLVDVSALRPLRVAVDAGNGMAGHTAPAVFGAIESLTVAPALLRTRRLVSQPRGQPVGSRQPGRLAEIRGGDRRRYRSGLRR